MITVNNKIAALYQAAFMFASSTAAAKADITGLLSQAVEASTATKQGKELVKGADDEAWSAWRGFTTAAIKAGAKPEVLGLLIDMNVGDNELAAASVKSYRSTVVGLAQVLASGKLETLAKVAGIKVEDEDKIGRNSASKLIKALRMENEILPKDRYNAAIRAIKAELDTYAETPKGLTGEERTKAKADAIQAAIEQAEGVMEYLGLDTSTLPRVGKLEVLNVGSDDENEQGDNEAGDGEPQEAKAA